MQAIPRSVTLLAAALTLASCGDAVGPLPRDTPPAELEFTIGGFAATSSTWRTAGDTVVLVRRGWGQSAPPLEEVRVVPTAEEWRGFWAAADSAGVHRWRGRYVDDRIADGTGWGLRLAAPGVRIVTGGSNAYPDRKGRRHSGTPTSAFDAFLQALEELTGSPR